MWFKNLYLYRFTKPFDMTNSELQDKLSSKPFIPCRKLDLESSGWVSPLKDVDDKRTDLVYTVQNRHLICLRRQEKIMPANVVKEKFKEKLRHLETQQNRRLSKDERNTLREETVLDLLPQAFAQSTDMYGYIDINNGWLAIDTSSHKKASDFASALRVTLDSLPVEMIEVCDTPELVMTEWVTKQSHSDQFTIESFCELSDLDSDSVVSCKQQDPFSEEMKGHFSAGKKITQIAVQWQEQLSFVLTHEFILKRLRFLEAFQTNAKNETYGDAMQRFDSDFVLMTLLLTEIVQELLSEFGGLVD